VRFVGALLLLAGCLDVPAAIGAPDASPPCDAPWSRPDPARSCFRAAQPDGDVTWSEAAAACGSEGGVLASLASPLEVDLI
jgi:hypothetical protein